MQLENIPAACKTLPSPTSIAAVLLALVAPLHVTGNKGSVHYSKIVQKIEVHSESAGYTKQVTCHGQFISPSGKRILIYASELETITGFRNLLGQKSDGSDNFQLTEHTVTADNFYDGLKVYSLKCTDKAMAFILQYKVTCRQLVMLSHLPFADHSAADTVSYEIECPRGYHIAFNTSDSLSDCIIDSVITKRNITYIITSLSKDRLRPPLIRSSQYEIADSEPAALRILPISAAHQNGWHYFNEWYLELARSHSKPNKETIQLFEKVAPERTDEEKTIQACFDYVRSNIRYLAIENGLEAFRPRDVNAVIRKRYGDCKDMANLLSVMLRHYNVHADIALIATLGYPYRMDFPSLASANHAVCIATTSSGKVYYLDATDKNGSYNLPSPFTQGQPYFAINAEGGHKGMVPLIQASRNRTIMQVDLAADTNTIKGSCKIVCSNYESSILRSMSKESGLSPAMQRLIREVTNARTCTSYSDISFDQKDSISSVTGSVAVRNGLLHSGNRSWLILNFLSFPHQFPQKISEGFRLIPYRTCTRLFRYRLRFKGEVSLSAGDIRFAKNMGVCSFEYKVTKSGPATIDIEYTYTMLKADLDRVEGTAYEELNNDILRLFNTPVQYDLVKDE